MDPYCWSKAKSSHWGWDIAKCLPPFRLGRLQAASQNSWEGQSLFVCGTVTRFNQSLSTASVQWPIPPDLDQCLAYHSYEHSHIQQISVQKFQVNKQDFPANGFPQKISAAQTSPVFGRITMFVPWNPMIADDPLKFCISNLYSKYASNSRNTSTSCHLIQHPVAPDPYRESLT